MELIFTVYDFNVNLFVSLTLSYLYEEGLVSSEYLHSFRNKRINILQLDRFVRKYKLVIMVNNKDISLYKE